MAVAPAWHAGVADVYARTKSLQLTADELGVSKQRVWQVLRARGVVLRSPGRGREDDCPRTAEGKFAPTGG